MIQPGADFESLLLKFNVSTKSKLQVYIDKNRYPSHEAGEYSYAVGDLPDSVLTSMGTKSSMLEIMQDMTPFALDADWNVKYMGSFKHMNCDLFKAEHQEKLDSRRVQKLTTWT